MLRTGLGEHRRGVTHDEVARVGAALVDHDLVVGLRRPTRREIERVEVVVAQPDGTEDRRTHVGVADRLAGLVDELGIGLDVSLGDRDTIHLVDLVDE